MRQIVIKKKMRVDLHVPQDPVGHTPSPNNRALRGVIRSSHTPQDGLMGARQSGPAAAIPPTSLVHALADPRARAQDPIHTPIFAPDLPIRLDSSADLTLTMNGDVALALGALINHLDDDAMLASLLTKKHEKGVREAAHRMVLHALHRRASLPQSPRRDEIAYAQALSKTIRSLFRSKIIDASGSDFGSLQRHQFMKIAFEGYDAEMIEFLLRVDSHLWHPDEIKRFDRYFRFFLRHKSVRGGIETKKSILLLYLEKIDRSLFGREEKVIYGAFLEALTSVSAFNYTSDSQKLEHIDVPQLTKFVFDYVKSSKVSSAIWPHLLAQVFSISNITGLNQLIALHHDAFNQGIFFASIMDKYNQRGTVSIYNFLSFTFVHRSALRIFAKDATATSIKMAELLREKGFSPTNMYGGPVKTIGSLSQEMIHTDALLKRANNSQTRPIGEPGTHLALQGEFAIAAVLFSHARESRKTKMKDFIELFDNILHLLEQSVVENIKPDKLKKSLHLILKLDYDFGISAITGTFDPLSYETYQLITFLETPASLNNQIRRHVDSITSHIRHVITALQYAAAKTSADAPNASIELDLLEIDAANQAYEMSINGFILLTRNIEYFSCARDAVDLQNYLNAKPQFTLAQFSRAFSLSLANEKRDKPGSCKKKSIAPLKHSTILLAACPNATTHYSALFIALTMKRPQTALAVLASIKQLDIHLLPILRDEDAHFLSQAIQISLDVFTELVDVVGPKRTARWLYHTDSDGDVFAHTLARHFEIPIKQVMALYPRAQLEPHLCKQRGQGRPPFYEALAFGNLRAIEAFCAASPTISLDEAQFIEAIRVGFAVPDSPSWAHLCRTVPGARERLVVHHLELRELLTERGLKASLTALELELGFVLPPQGETHRTLTKNEKKAAKKGAARDRRKEQKENFALKVLLAGKQVGPREEAIHQFLDRYGATPAQETALDPHVYASAIEEASRILDALQAVGRGATLGYHFAAHRPSLDDRRTLRRIVAADKPGSSRFGPRDAVALLRARRSVLDRAEELASLQEGRYTIYVRDPCLAGLGWTAAHPGEPIAFTQSPILRFVVEWDGLTSAPRIISVYPVPPSCVATKPFDVFLPSSAAAAVSTLQEDG